MRIAGLSVWGILFAALVFNAISFAWYAVLFGEAWITDHGFAPGAGHAGAPAWRLVGPLLALLQVVGLALVLKWRDWPPLAGAVSTALTMALVFALPVLAYDTVNLPDHNVMAFLIDAAHLGAAWAVAAIILTLMR